MAQAPGAGCRGRKRSGRKRPGRPQRGGRPGGLPGGLPEGFPENLADGLANLPPGLGFPPAKQGNIPAAFRGGNPKRKKK